MQRFPSYLIAFTVAVATATHAQAQARPAAPAADTDVYHVMFVKAVPGQAAAETAELLKQDPKDPLASHLLLLRHQEGADWDYCLIQHLGPRATVTITPAGPTPTTPATRAWHNDTFVSGPSWAEFSKAMLVIRFKFQELEPDGAASLRTDHRRINLDIRLTLWGLQHHFNERSSREGRGGLDSTASHGHISDESVDRRLVYGNGRWNIGHESPVLATIELLRGMSGS